MSTNFTIQNLKQLREIIPDYPKMMDNRIKQTLDLFSQEFLEASSLAIFSCTAMKTIDIIALKTAGLSQHGDTLLGLKMAQPLSFNLPESADPSACSLYFLIAGIGHGLRINGELKVLSQGQDKEVSLEIRIRQVYFHCSRAIVRANFWQHHLNHVNHHSTTYNEQLNKQLNKQLIKQHETLNAASRDFISQSALAFICSYNAKGKLEMSPRGDAPGFVKTLSDQSLLIPERPGNKVAITLRNILEQPAIKVLFLAPGQNRVLQVSGRASLSQQPDYLQQLVSSNKVPKIAILLEIDACQLCDATSLKDADIWNKAHYRRPDEFNSFAKIMNTHLHGTSLLAKTLQPVVSAVIKHDLKNLY